MDDSRAAVGTEADESTGKGGSAADDVEELSLSETEGFLDEDQEDEGDEVEDECLPPHFVDLFAGERFPMARAMQWCGWTVSIFEKYPNGCTCDLNNGCSCGMSRDLLSKEVKQEAMGQIKRAQASWSAMDCRSLSRARGRPIPGLLNC